MIDKLYKQFASYYTGVTSDRNYKEHLDLILNSFQNERPCRSLMELFAGQALHSIEALRRKDIDVWAIDFSAEMKEVALTEGFKNPDQYIVGSLPEVILNCAGKVKFDCMIGLSCSITHLNKDAVYQMLENSKQVLNKKGKIFIEMYDIISFMAYAEASAYAYSGFPETQNSKGETIRLLWPSGKMNWSHYSYTLEIPVKLNIESVKGIETVEFISEQHIHSAEDIIFIAGLLGYSSKILTDQDNWRMAFDSNVVIELTYE